MDLHKVFRDVLVFFIILLLSSSAASSKYEVYLPKVTVNKITTDGNSLWFSTYGAGIHQFIPKENKWNSYSTVNKNLDEDFFYCIAASKDYVWAGTSDGLFIFERKKNQWKKRKFAIGGELGNWIRTLCYDEKQNVLWIGRFKNLTRFDVAKQKYEDFDLTIDNDPKTNTFKTIEIENEQYIWFATEAGVHRYDKMLDFSDPASRQFISNKKNSFKSEGEYVSVNDFYFDKNVIWIATDEFITKEKPEFNVGGIYLFNRRATWEKIDRKNGLPANGVYALERCGNRIWAGIYQFNKNEKSLMGKGLVQIDRVKGKVLKINLDEIGLTTSTILCLYFDGKNMWMGTDAGLWCVNISNPFGKWNTQKETKK
jgi:ligand-binding sensor domain-containing protein